MMWSQPFSGTIGQSAFYPLASSVGFETRIPVAFLRAHQLGLYQLEAERVVCPH